MLSSAAIQVFSRALHLCVLCLAFFLAGCYPDYNWRVMPIADGVVSVAFPARVNSQSRPIELAGVQLDYHVESARVDNNIFAFGYARLPEGLDAEKRKAIVDALTDNLFRSLGATPGEQARQGKPFVIESAHGTNPLLVAGRVLEHRGLVIRMMASGPVAELPEKMALEFIGSLELR